MMKQIWRSACLGMGLFAAGHATADYSKHPETKAFVDRMAKEYGFDAKNVQSVLAQAEKKQAILDAIARPAEKTKPWYEYRKIFLDKDRVQQGVVFLE